jgi:hypothetical protein
MLDIASLLLTGSLVLGSVAVAAPATDPTSRTATDPDDRAWAVNRPSRAVPAVRTASLPPRSWAGFAACVEDRESGGNPTILNRQGSGAAGLFQFMPAWRHGAPYIVRERLLQFGATKRQAKAVREYLTGLGRIERWPALYQRIAFAEVLEDGLWKHWHLAGSRCNSLVPAGAR